MFELEATRLKGNDYVVRPVGQLGTCGYYPYPWTARFVTAKNDVAALLKAYILEESAMEQENV